MKLFYFLIILYALPACNKEVSHEMLVNMIDSHGEIYRASSELNPSATGLGKYGVHNLFDGDAKTAWAEGVKGKGINESIKIVVKNEIEKIELINGYAKSDIVFKKNNRIKKIEITAYEIELPREGMVSERFTPVMFKAEISKFTVMLRDTMMPQSISLTSEWVKKISKQKKYGIQFKILSVYPGSKFDDTCLSELRFIYQVMAKKEVEIKNNDSEVWIKAGTKSQLALKNKNAIYQLIETDKENRWSILIEMPSEGVGRMETTYLLLSLTDNKLISLKDIQELYGFKYKKDVTFLQAYDSNTKMEVLINLSKFIK